ncbi:hypothetical protein JTE90_029261 [Oedothorax gibbosus]|uniref:Uncharacterized protein n=1 Tax=Oedothorax gibbosus TaxID=931172 RepID=A0AAV6TVT0_9ARAC|nr:hypothetical protein JTE90_029261 [Oedothorax gibbosus]
MDSSFPDLISAANSFTTLSPEMDAISDFEGNVISDGYDIESEEYYLDISDEEESVKDFLKRWYFESQVSLCHLTSLLKGLRKWHPELPNTAVTLLKTPGQVDIKEIGKGEFHHFGLRKEILNAMETTDIEVDSLSLNFNIDGLPVSKS